MTGMRESLIHLFYIHYQNLNLMKISFLTSFHSRIFTISDFWWKYFASKFVQRNLISYNFISSTSYNALFLYIKHEFMLYTKVRQEEVKRSLCCFLHYCLEFYNTVFFFVGFKRWGTLIEFWLVGYKIECPNDSTIKCNIQKR